MINIIQQYVSPRYPEKDKEETGYEYRSRVAAMPVVKITVKIEASDTATWEDATLKAAQDISDLAKDKAWGRAVEH